MSLYQVLRELHLDKKNTGGTETGDSSQPMIHEMYEGNLLFPMLSWRCKATHGFLVVANDKSRHDKVKKMHIKTT